MLQHKHYTQIKRATYLSTRYRVLKLVLELKAKARKKLHIFRLATEYWNSSPACWGRFVPQATYLSTRYRVLKPEAGDPNLGSPHATYLSTRYRVLKHVSDDEADALGVGYISFDSLQSTETWHPVLWTCTGLATYLSTRYRVLKLWTTTYPRRSIWLHIFRLATEYWNAKFMVLSPYNVKLHIFRLATEYWNVPTTPKDSKPRSATYLSTRYRVLKPCWYVDSMCRCTSYISFDSLQSTETVSAILLCHEFWSYISFDSLQSTETMN